MKIDKSTALFLSNILFHYERLMRDSLSNEDEIITAVRLTRNELNDSILSDESHDVDEKYEEAFPDHVHPSYDFSIGIEDLCSLGPLKTRYDGKIVFKHAINNTVDICEYDVPEHCDKDVKYVKRTGKALYYLTRADIIFINEESLDIDIHTNWSCYDVFKFPTSWIDRLDCGMVYKCA